MSFILQPSVVYKLDEENENKGIFEVSPLNRGYGYTLGNTLRRVLLSSIPGAAITSIRIEGVRHELSSMEGVSEDTLMIMMKLKKVRIKMGATASKVNLYLEKSGGIITAGDFEVTGDAEIINKDLEIASVEKGKKLTIEAIAEKGYGYLPIDDRQNEDLPIDFFALDAVFSPVLSVKYYVEPTRVGQVTSLDKLVLDLETDGSVDVLQAISEALRTLEESILNMQNALSVASPAKDIKDEEPIFVPQDNSEDYSKKTLEELTFSQRTFNALKNNGVDTLKDLESIAKRDGGRGINNLRGVGKKAVEEIQEKLVEYGIKF